MMYDTSLTCECTVEVFISMSRLRQTAVYMMSYCDEIQEVVLAVVALAEPALVSHNSVLF